VFSRSAGRKFDAAGCVRRHKCARAIVVRTCVLFCCRRGGFVCAIPLDGQDLGPGACAAVSGAKNIMAVTSALRVCSVADSVRRLLKHAGAVPPCTTHHRLVFGSMADRLETFNRCLSAPLFTFFFSGCAALVGRSWDCVVDPPHNTQGAW
jgi:hypothetical protein